MGGPRIIFTRFADSNSPKLTPWRDHRRRVVGSAGQSGRQSSEPLSVVWQLISANNRELARSADVYDDFQDAVSSATEAVELIATDGSVVQVSDERHGSYGWYITLFDLPAVVCSRWYLAERERRHAVALTLKSLPIASITAGARQHVELSTHGQRN
ncbi:hypothetical protein [Diaminobutyricimonas sp. TR449]|uniref:hypothetical protein n=1 Tax=Diaminobutyricimonas sp. TR449 TaxID=2708076 RepID=UPI001424337D|nr:hypothetical protein [Diaminobutyricimonas sp. TR449]